MSLFSLLFGRRANGPHMACRAGIRVQVALLLLTACREPLEPGALPATVARTDQYLAQLVVAPGTTTDQWIVRATVAGGVATTRVAGFRARLVLPPSLSIAGNLDDQGMAEGTMLRVIRMDGNHVLAIGAHAEGMPLGDLFVVTVNGPVASLSGLQLEVEELVDVRGTNQIGRTIIAPRINDARIRK